MIRQWIVVWILLMCTAGAQAETVTLKTGKVIEGEVIEKTEEHVRIDSGKKEWKIRFKMMSPESAEALKLLPEKLIHKDDSRKEDGVITAMVETISEDPVTTVTLYYNGSKEIAMRKEIRPLPEEYEELVEQLSGSPADENAALIVMTEFVKAIHNPKESQVQVVAEEGTIPDGWVTVYQNNNVIQQEYQDGKLNGKSVTYGPDGNVIEEVYFVDGKRHGQSTSYFSHLQKSYMKYEWDMGQVTESVFYEQGKVAQKGFTREGELVQLISYDDNGNIADEWKAEEVAE